MLSDVVTFLLFVCLVKIRKQETLILKTLSRSGRSIPGRFCLEKSVRPLNVSNSAVKPRVPFRVAVGIATVGGPRGQDTGATAHDRGEELMREVRFLKFSVCGFNYCFGSVRRGAAALRGARGRESRVGDTESRGQGTSTVPAETT